MSPVFSTPLHAQHVTILSTLLVPWVTQPEKHELFPARGTQVFSTHTNAEKLRHGAHSGHPHPRGHRLDIRPLILFRLQHSVFLLMGFHGLDFLSFQAVSWCCYWVLPNNNKWVAFSHCWSTHRPTEDKMQASEGGPGGPCHLVSLVCPFPHKPTFQELASTWTCLMCQAASHFECYFGARMCETV